MNDIRSIFEMLGDLTVHNLPVILGIGFVGVKLVLIRLTGNKEDMWRGFVSVPEDVAYASLGFIMAGISGAIKSFGNYFKDSPHLLASLWMLFVANVGICLIVHLIHQHGSVPGYQGWQAAGKLLRKEITFKEAREQSDLGPGDTDFSFVYFWKFGQFCLSLMMECVFSFGWLLFIAKIIENY